MKTEQLRPDLMRWTVPHPDWKPAPDGTPASWDREVGCVWHEPPEGAEPLVLIDPQAPAEGSPEAQRFWEMLDASLERSQRSLAVVLANNFHYRSAPEIAARFGERPGCAVWAPAPAREYLQKAGCPVTRTYEDGERLAGGLQAYAIDGLCPGETALYLPRHRALIAADAVLGAPGGKLQVPPASWASDAGRYHEAFRPSLRRVLELPIEMVLVSHGTPVLKDGHRLLSEALEAPAGTASS